jgi:hypothetical protein
MATRTQSNTRPQAEAPDRRPTHHLYRVQGDGAATIWTIIGAAWPNKDGKGFSINCEAIPLTGRIVLRSIPPAARQQEDGQLV